MVIDDYHPELRWRGSQLHYLTKHDKRDIATAQRAVNRVVLYRPVYPAPMRGGRIDAARFILNYVRRHEVR